MFRCISTTCSVRQGAVVCSYSEEDNLTRQRGWSRSRTLSVSYAGNGNNEQNILMLYIYIYIFLLFLFNIYF